MVLSNTDNKSDFPICRFSKEYIYVQSVISSKNTNNFSDSIILHIMNTCSKTLNFNNKNLLSANEINKKFCKGEELEEDTSAIHIQIPIGKGDEAFVDGKAYEDFQIIMPSHNWVASDWEVSVSGNSVNCSITALQSQMVLEEYECISIGITNIVSHCLPGATYVRIFVENVANVTELFKTFNLMKTLAPLTISNFTAERYVLSPGDNARLTWKTAERTNGKILSKEFCISSDVPEYNEKLMNSKTYMLEIENEHESCKASCAVYVSPPIIRDFSLEIQSSDVNAKWKTEYVSKININDEKCEESGSMTFPKDTEVVTLRCEGYLYTIERTLYSKYLCEVVLECRRFIFQYYTVIQVSWKVNGVNGCKLLIQEPENHYVTDLTKGSFEYVYMHPCRQSRYRNSLRMCFIDKTSKEVELYKSLNWKG